MGWLWRVFKPEPKDPNPVPRKDPQYIPPGPDDGLWLDGPPKGSPEHRTWIRWLSE